MENENEQTKQQQSTIPNESNLLESKVIEAPVVEEQQPQQSVVQNADDERPISGAQEQPTNSFDEVPIGGGSKFQWSEFPEQGDGSKVAPKKSTVKKAPVKPKPAVTKPPASQQHSEKPTAEQKQAVVSSSADDTPLPSNNPRPLDEIPISSNTNPKMPGETPVNQFDQKPIGKSTFDISEFPEDQDQQPPQQTQYPMLQKLKSKAAKLRFSGMQDLLKLLQENPQDPDIAEIDIKSLVKETTPANLQKGLLCLKLWVEKGKSWGDIEVKNAIENGMAKVNTKKITVEICDLMYEEKSSAMQTSILLGFKGKVAKAISYYMMIVSELLAIYGIKKMKYLKPYIPEIVKLLNDKKDLAIKSEGEKILKEAYKWLGRDVVLPMLGDLKETIKKQLDSFWDSYDKDTPMKAPKGEEAAEEQGGGKGKKKKVDAYDLSEPVDIFKKFNEKWVDSVLNAPKWSEKVKMLEEFVKAASVPKLANTEYRHINEMIRRLINDSNFNVVLWDMRVLAAMARGLRRHYYAGVKNNFANVMWKFRDKKTQMVDETFNTLNDFLHSVSLEEVVEDVKEGLQDKAPNMKCNLVNWVGKFVEVKGEENGELSDKASDAVKALFPIFEKLLNDGTAQVRDTMARNVFKMKLIIGDEFFESLENKMSKTLANKAESKVKAKTKSRDKSVEKDMSKSSVSVIKGGKKEEEKSSMSKTMTSAGNKKQKKVQQPELKIQKFEEPTFEEACDRIVANGFPEQELKNIKANGAKERTAAFNLLKDQTENMLEVFVVIRAIYKDWKEINLVMNKELIALIEERAEYIEKPEMSVLIPYFIEKVGESKFAEPLYKSLEKICERIPGVFLVSQFIDKVKAYDNKKPKMNSDVCVCISRIITFVSAANVPVREAILFADSCYKVQFSKKGAVELLKTLYSYIGDQVKVYLQSDTYSSLEPQFRKTGVLSEQQKRPKVEMVGEAGEKQKKTVNLLGDKPKVDITHDVQRLLPKMNDSANWQNRKDSAEALIGLINENFGRVTINCMSDLMNGLKIRINDPNKQLIRVFMQLTGLLFPVLNEKELKIYGKMFTGALADGLSDKMESNRKQATATLNKIGECIGQEHLLYMLAHYLEGDKESRIQVIQIMLASQEYLSKTDTRDFPKGITNCLCDKNREIRSLGEKLFERVYEKIGIQAFRNIAKNQRPAITKDLNEIYDKYEKGGGFESQTIISKASSPGKEKTTSSAIRNPPSAKKRSLSKSNIKPQQRSYIEIEDEGELPNSKSRIQTPPPSSSLVQGDEYFAPLKQLTSFRVQRQEHEGWKLDEIREQEEDFLREQLEALLRKDLHRKMLSFNTRRVNEGVLSLIKLSKELSYQAQFREVYDLLLKWSLLRLWGGSPGLLSVVEIFPPVLSILEKKKVAMNDAEVDLVVAIIREYLISAFLNASAVSDSLNTILRTLVSLSSGQRVARKLLRQFSVELTSIHRYLKKDVNLYYRDGLSRLTKSHLMDYVGNEDMLEEISRIKELRSDPEFVDILYGKFHEAILNDFGFRKYVAASGNAPQGTTPPLPPSHPRVNNHQQPVPVSTGTGLPRRERSKSNESKNMDKGASEGGRLVAKSRVSSSEQNSRSSRPPSGQQPKMASESEGHTSEDYNNNESSCQTGRLCSEEMDLSIYPAPHPISPLGKHLSKLFPPNEQTVTFFTQLFSEQGEKIANELISHSKIIFGSILKSVMQMLESRQEHSPERIVTQINLLQQCIKCKFVIQNLDELLYTGTNFALKQLVHEDENKLLIQEDLHRRGIDYKIENFIKVINGVMLRILENGNPQQVVNTLLQIHNEFLKAPQKSVKTTYLIIKCTSRIAATYTVAMNPELSIDFFLAVNEYFALETPPLPLQELQLPTHEKPKPEENFINSIKTIIFDLCRILNSDIWDLYDRAMHLSKYEDTLIGSYIQSLGVPYQSHQEQDKPSSSHHIRGQSGSKENEQIRRISELLSKNKTFDSGIASLKKFIKSNPSFNPIEYFTSLGYDQKFIAMVMNGLEGKERRTPRKDNARDDKSNKSKSPIGSTMGSGANQQQENIQDKIRKLKQKFEQIQPPEAEERPKENTQQNTAQHSHLKSNSKISEHEGSTQPREDRTLEIKRRIDQMKNRLNKNVEKQPR